jgi:hypothetical protein
MEQFKEDFSGIWVPLQQELVSFRALFQSRELPIRIALSGRMADAATAI